MKVNLLGRNDLCSCGSGKKYKKCCLNKNKQNSILRRKIELSQQYDIQLTKKVFEYARSERLYKEYVKAQDKFFILKNNGLNKQFARLFNTYYIQDYISSKNKSISILFYEENKNNLNPVEKNILKNRLNSYVSIYEVIEIKEDKAIVKDLILKEDTYVEDLTAVNDLKVGEIIIARIANIVNINRFLDMIISISSGIKDTIISDMNAIYENQKPIYKNKKHFLIYNTVIFYRYVQQLLEPKIGQYLNTEKKGVKNQSTNQIEKCEVKKLIRDNLEEEYLEVALTAWEEYKKEHTEVKGSEGGWASALEYHIKKEKGLSITQGDVAKKYKVSPSTLGKRYKEIKTSCIVDKN